MDVTWIFNCDSGHSWASRLRSDEQPSEAHLICPTDATSAVTATRMPPADRVAIRFHPAARIADGLTNAIQHDDEFFLEISTLDGASDLWQWARP